jgi:hypothetical protein
VSNLSTSKVLSILGDSETANRVRVSLEKLLPMLLASIIYDECGSKRVNRVNSVGML